ncbi:MAG TPA: DUF2156 domain-containing protein [Candidatus Lumbricidophila sp.]|nr:DUF2156 domain-containing protein [Candidatus Lumbricidophila sp.]
MTRRQLLAFLRVIPLSLSLAATLLLTACVFGTIAHDPTKWVGQTFGAGAHNVFVDGRWWTIATSWFVPYDPFQAVAAVIAAVVLLGIAEHRLGAARTIVAFLATGTIGVLGGVTAQWLGHAAGEWWSRHTIADVTLDPLNPIIGTLITATACFGQLWRRRIRLVTFALLIMFVCFDGDPSNVYRLLAALGGLALGRLGRLGRRSGAGGHLLQLHSSHAESRNLVAAVIAITAIGPIVSRVTHSHLTPFATNTYLTPQQSVSLAAVRRSCEAAVRSEACQSALASYGHQGAGGFWLGFVPVALLIVAAIGLRRGRRFAFWLAAVVTVVIAVTNSPIRLISASEFISLRGGDDFANLSVVDLVEAFVTAISGLLIPAVALTVLVLTRRRFTVRVNGSALRRFWLSVVVTFVLLAATYFVAGLVSLPNYMYAAQPGDVALDVLRRFLPRSVRDGLGLTVVPSGGFTAFAFHWVGVAFWAVFIAASLWLLRSRSRANATAANVARHRELLHTFGGGTLGFMSTWEGNTPWLTADRNGALAVRVLSGVAIVLGDPLCAPGREAAVIHEFIAYCDRASITPVFYSVHSHVLEVFDELGWRHTSVGEETLVPTDDLTLDGKRWQKVRYPLNRGRSEGIEAVWTTWRELSLTRSAQILALSEAWVSEKQLPEMGFTLGGIDELKHPDVRLMLAVGPDDRLQAVTSWLPVFRGGQIIGWTLDFMRRADDSMPGVMEFVLASVALHIKAQGGGVMSLSGAPLATKPLAPGECAEEPSGLARVLDFLARTLEPAYGFQSLFRYKAKFHPQYETLSLAYPEAISLPAIALALGRAYLPTVGTREALSLLRSLGR